MSWDALGAIAEAIGALGVILTLIYLSAQVRQNTEQMRDTAKDVRLDSFDRTVQTFSRFREYLTRDGNAALLAKGLDSYSDLTEAEKYRFRAVIEEYFYAFHALFLRVGENRYDRDLWRSQMRGPAQLMNRSGGREWWTERCSGFSEPFRAEAESIAREIAE